MNTGLSQSITLPLPSVYGIILSSVRGLAQNLGQLLADIPPKDTSQIYDAMVCKYIRQVNRYLASITLPTFIGMHFG